MPGADWGCGSALSGAAYYLPCAAWLWPEGEPEEAQLLQQPPSQNLSEALIPPAQAQLYERREPQAHSNSLPFIT